MSDNPFIPAAWGSEYDLAGALWKPEGSLLCGGVAKQEVGICDGCLFHCTHSNKPKFKDKESLNQYRERVQMLLPSPDWINQQPNPREVAIAALVRSGFTTFAPRPEEAEPTHNLMIETSHDEACIGLYEAQHALTITLYDCTDPALAQYAVDCFKVLSEWSKQIQWEVK